MMRAVVLAALLASSACLPVDEAIDGCEEACNDLIDRILRTAQEIVAVCGTEGDLTAEDLVAVLDACFSQVEWDVLTAHGCSWHDTAPIAVNEGEDFWDCTAGDLCR